MLHTPRVIVSFAILATIDATLAQHTRPAAQSSPATSPAGVNAQGMTVDLEVIIDPRIELLLIVQHLTGDYERRTNLITDFDFEYKREIEAHFRPFEDHPVIATYAGLARQGFSFDAGPKAVLSLTPDAELKLRAPLPEDVLPRVGGAEAFEKFRAQIVDFAVASGFFEFFAQHQPLYDELTFIVRKGLQPAVLVGSLNEYTGMQVRNAHLVLFPLGHPGGFAAQITPVHDGKADDMEVYAIIGPGGAIDDRPTWSTVPWAESLVIHEFAHTIVNPLTEKHRERVAKSVARLEPIKAQMSRQAYQSWETVVNEHIVRAIEARIALRRHGFDAGNRKMMDLRPAVVYGRRQARLRASLRSRAGAGSLRTRSRTMEDARGFLSGTAGGV